MNNHSKLLRQLEELRVSNPNIFLNLKLNVNSIHQKLKIQALEDSFFEQKGDFHAIYEIAPDVQETFAKGLNRSCNNVLESYFIVSPDGCTAAFYQLGTDFLMRRQACIFNKERITDILDTFEGHFKTIVQDDPDGYNEPAEEAHAAQVDFTEDDWVAMFEED